MPVKGYISKKRNNITQCKIPGCTGGPNNKGCYCKGFCMNHYNRYRIGLIDADGTPTGEPSEQTRIRVEALPKRAKLSGSNVPPSTIYLNLEILTNSGLKKLLKEKKK